MVTLDEICGGTLTAKQYTVIGWGAISTATLSLFASSFILVTFLKFGSTRKLHMKIIFSLAMADFGWSLEMFINYVGVLSNTRPAPGTSEGIVWSCLLRQFYQYFSASSICWTTAFAVFLFLSFYEYPIHQSKIFKALSMICWGIPVVLTSILFMFRNDQNPNCIPKPSFHLLIWGTFIVASFTFNFIMYILMLKRYFSKVKKFSQKEAPVSLKLTLYIFAFLFCWTVNVIWISLSFLIGREDRTKTCNSYMIQFFSLFTLNATGLLDCIVYGLTSRVIRKNYSITSGSIYLLIAPIILIPMIIIKLISKISSSDRNRSLRDLSINRSTTATISSSSSSSSRLLQSGLDNQYQYHSIPSSDSFGRSISIHPNGNK